MTLGTPRVAGACGSGRTAGVLGHRSHQDPLSSGWVVGWQLLLLRCLGETENGLSGMRQTWVEAGGEQNGTGQL